MAVTYTRRVSTSTAGYAARSRTERTVNPAAASQPVSWSTVQNRKSIDTGTPHHSSKCRVSVPTCMATSKVPPGARTRRIPASAPASSPGGQVRRHVPRSASQIPDGSGGGAGEVVEERAVQGLAGEFVADVLRVRPRGRVVAGPQNTSGHHGLRAPEKARPVAAIAAADPVTSPAAAIDASPGPPR